MIQRYDWDETGLELEKLPLGRYVLYADHEAAMKEKNERVAELLSKHFQELAEDSLKIKNLYATNADLLKKLEEAKGEIAELQKAYTEKDSLFCKEFTVNQDLRAKLAAAEKVIKWALGEVDDFPPRENGEGAYWWRKELRKRAGLQYQYIRDKRTLEADHD